MILANPGPNTLSVSEQGFAIAPGILDKSEWHILELLFGHDIASAVNLQHPIDNFPFS